MAGPFLGQDFTHYAQLEAVWGTSPGALAGTDAFKCKTQYPFERVKARLDRDQDSGRQPSVTTTQGGRESSTWEIEADLIPSDNATTPTAPDMDPFFHAHFGLKLTGTAHTLTAGASTGTTLNLTVGGGASSGIAIGQLIAISVDDTIGFEVRRVVNIAGDVVTIDRALSANPINGRVVRVGITYKFSQPELKSVHIWEFLDGDNFRHLVGGAVARQMTLACDFASDVPVATTSFNGEGDIIETHATAEPVAVTAGLPLVPPKSYMWIGDDRHCLCKVDVASDNGIELRNNQSCSLTPSGMKRTGNNGHYLVTLTASLLLETGTVEGYYDDASGLTAYSVLVQLGDVAGSIVAFTAPKWVPDVPVEDLDGDVSLGLTGRCYGTAGDDDFYLGFL